MIINRQLIFVIIRNVNGANAILKVYGTHRENRFKQGPPSLNNIFQMRPVTVTGTGTPMHVNG